MRLIIQPTSEAIGRWTARHIAGRLREFNPSSGRPFVLGLPTGSSPLPAYRELIRLHREEGLSFRHVVTFNMDEYAGLPGDHPESYRAFMRRHLFDAIDIPAGQTNLLDGNAADPEAECARYEERIRAAGGISLFLGGVGADGHLAFNEPGSSLTSRTRVKTLTRDTRIANARFFGGDVEKVPHRALTVGVGTVMDAREVVLLVTGHHKARALAAVVEGGINHLWTASALQNHPQGVIVCDEDSCAELKVGTYRYFRDIEAGERLEPGS